MFINIQFTGHFHKKDNVFIAKYLSEYDLVIMQELIASPTDITFADGSVMKVDKQALDFVQAMQGQGFDYLVSNEDTGSPSSFNSHSNGTDTEFFITFYKSEIASVDTTLSNEFIDTTHFQHPIFARVPHTFSFKTLEVNDFTFLSVHLEATASHRDIRERT